MGLITDEFVKIAKAQNDSEINYIAYQKAMPDHQEFIGKSDAYADQSYVFYYDNTIIGYFKPVIYAENVEYSISSPVIYVSERKYGMYCLVAMVSYIMTTLGCDKISIEVFDSNKLMLKILNRMGIREEGIFRKYRNRISSKDKHIFAFTKLEFKHFREKLSSSN